jgi:hypothetical protein
MQLLLLETLNWTNVLFGLTIEVPFIEDLFNKREELLSD